MATKGRNKALQVIGKSPARGYGCTPGTLFFEALLRLQVCSSCHAEYRHKNNDECPCRNKNVIPFLNFKLSRSQRTAAPTKAAENGALWRLGLSDLGRSLTAPFGSTATTQCRQVGEGRSLLPVAALMCLARLTFQAICG